MPKGEKFAVCLLLASSPASCPLMSPGECVVCCVCRWHCGRPSVEGDLSPMEAMGVRALVFSLGYRARIREMVGWRCAGPQPQNQAKWNDPIRQRGPIHAIWITRPGFRGHPARAGSLLCTGRAGLTGLAETSHTALRLQSRFSVIQVGRVHDGTWEGSAQT